MLGGGYQMATVMQLGHIVRSLTIIRYLSSLVLGSLYTLATTFQTRGGLGEGYQLRSILPASILITEIGKLDTTQIPRLPITQSDRVGHHCIEPVFRRAKDVHQLLGIIADEAAHHLPRDVIVLKCVELGTIDGVEQTSVANLFRSVVLFQIGVHPEQVLVECSAPVYSAACKLLKKSELVLRKRSTRLRYRLLLWLHRESHKLMSFARCPHQFILCIVKIYEDSRREGSMGAPRVRMALLSVWNKWAINTFFGSFMI